MILEVFIPPIDTWFNYFSNPISSGRICFPCIFCNFCLVMRMCLLDLQLQMPPSDIHSHVVSNGLIQDRDQAQQRQQGKLIAWKYGTLLTGERRTSLTAQMNFLKCHCLVRVFQPTFPTIPLHLHCSSMTLPPISSSVSVSSHRYVPEFGFFIFKHLDQIKLFILCFADSVIKEWVDICYNVIERI